MRPRCTRTGAGGRSLGASSGPALARAELAAPCGPRWGVARDGGFRTPRSQGVSRSQTLEQREGRGGGTRSPVPPRPGDPCSKLRPRLRNQKWSLSEAGVEGPPEDPSGSRRPASRGDGALGRLRLHVGRRGLILGQLPDSQQES
ncbi:hypothetical protein PAL_GLEAN10014579 [Pteropus alecto]|uniref:Uncharacterized protein n=1 Tax=Pteropus alecto TaxID=9402 RepID=L5KN82_PTEAL|nr:hypothetical protein PAL_GLEAN10014579 [Pteropus alecto]